MCQIDRRYLIVQTYYRIRNCPIERSRNCQTGHFRIAPSRQIDCCHCHCRSAQIHYHY